MVVSPVVNGVKIVPAVVMRPIAPGFALLANQRLPSGPAAIPQGRPAAGNSVTTGIAAVVIRPMPLGVLSVNQRFPSGPAVIARRPLLDPWIWVSLTTPAGVIRPIRSLDGSVNQRFPSGPAAMSSAPPLVVADSVTTGVAPVVMRPMRFLLR